MQSADPRSPALTLDHRIYLKHSHFFFPIYNHKSCCILPIITELDHTHSFTNMAPSAISPPLSPRNHTEANNDLSSYNGYHHVHWYVGNAKQAAAFYVSRMGFEMVAYKGLETGSRAIASHVIRNGNVTFVLTSPLRCLEQAKRFSPEDEELLKEIHQHQERHGDAVKGMESLTLA